MLDGDEVTSAANPAGANDKSTKKLSRRTLLKGAGAAAGADAIRGFPTDAPAQVCTLQRINGVIAIEALLVGGGLLAGHPDQLLAPAPPGRRCGRLGEAPPPHATCSHQLEDVPVQCCWHTEY
jgi:hypothetical protein